MVEWEKEFKIGQYTFSLIEIRDLLISILALGFIFSAALQTFQIEQTTPFYNFLVAVLIVGPALLFHELAHKITAQKSGCKAEYRLWPTGVILSIFLTLITGGKIIFAALGAVMISTFYPTRFGYRFVGLTAAELGKIALAGPVTNIIIAIIAYPFISINPQIAQTIVTINLVIALFNTLPFPPLDGAKIFGWNKLIWFGLLLVCLLLLYVAPWIGILLSIIIVLIILIVLFFILQREMGLEIVSPLRPM